MKHDSKSAEPLQSLRKAIGSWNVRCTEAEETCDQHKCTIQNHGY